MERLEPQALKSHNGPPQPTRFVFIALLVGLVMHSVQEEWRCVIGRPVTGLGHTGAERPLFAHTLRSLMNLYAEE
jgi:hypothetical protein